MVIDILKTKNSLSTDENGKILVSPISQFEFKTNPIGEGDSVVLVTEDEYIGLLLKLYQFDEALGAVVAFDNSKFREFLQAKIKEKQNNGG